MRYLLISLIITMSMFTAWAQPKEHPAHEPLRQMRAEMEQAMNAGDIDGLTKHVTDDLVFTTMNGDVVQGKDGLVKYYEKMMKGPTPRVKSIKTHFEADALTILYGDKMGVAYGYSDDHYVLADGSEFNVKPRWSATMVEQNGTWKIANFHYSVNMFDNPVVAAVTQKTYMIVGVAAAVGVGLGLFVGALLFRRK